ncbi:unnamed protein product [Strongylus vulgaris]|uniref:Uncharacterized protein n=1 Tax=Strongylus vulgaris TaxID=40348 RepID=A0A3P7L307_STRVU|nr:unnamed protein product [Strongylus vulgaris]
MRTPINGYRLVGLLSAARLFHGNLIFMKKEQHRRRKLEKKICRRVGVRREVVFDGVRLEEFLTTCDWTIEEDPTKDYDAS